MGIRRSRPIVGCEEPVIRIECQAIDPEKWSLTSKHSLTSSWIDFVDAVREVPISVGREQPSLAVFG
jgi:hypothetical protein